MSFNDFVVLSVAAYPEPQQAIGYVDSQCSIMHPDTHRSVSSSLLEMKGRVRRILLQKGILRVGKLLNVLWQSLVAVPEGQ